jgi:hypothetical protein
MYERGLEVIQASFLLEKWHLALLTPSFLLINYEQTIK